MIETVELCIQEIKNIAENFFKANMFEVIDNVLRQRYKSAFNEALYKLTFNKHILNYHIEHNDYDPDGYRFIVTTLRNEKITFCPCINHETNMVYVLFQDTWQTVRPGLL